MLVRSRLSDNLSPHDFNGSRSRFRLISLATTSLAGTGTHVPDRSDVEDLRIARLDRLTLFFDRRRIVLHGLNLLERLAARLVLRVRMHGAQAADIDDELLRLAAEAEGLKKFCRIGIGRGLEDAVRSND